MKFCINTKYIKNSEIKFSKNFNNVTRSTILPKKKQKTLNPVWEECFEFDVSLEACRSQQAALALSVWDRDVLTADDFAGEAFVSLCRMPGVHSHAPPDPLRALELPLMQLHDRCK